MRDIVYVNPHDTSDVKVPWELSRLQWLMPAGQAYLLDGDERYAEAVRAVLEDWIDANPCAGTVNWSCTMEAALRILSWTWFFHVFHGSRAWADPAFRERFLCALYLHGDFTERHLEHSDVNGNHCTADAAGLVFAGLFFGPGKDPERWLARGWSLLQEELPRQVSPDGVDFEASVAYHRLVAELFLLPALYRRACGLDVPAEYRERLVAMARFTAAYSRPDGGTPLWGDADDARALPLGSQALHGPSLPARAGRRGVRRCGAARRLGRQPQRGVLAARAGGRGPPARCRDAAPPSPLQRLPRRRLLRPAQRGGPRLRGLRPGRPRRPRRPRPQRLPLVRGRSRRRAPRDRLRGLRLHRLVRRAQPLPLDRLPQHAASGRRGDEPPAIRICCGASVTTHGPRSGGSRPARRTTASAGHTRDTSASRRP